MCDRFTEEEFGYTKPHCVTTSHAFPRTGVSTGRHDISLRIDCQVLIISSILPCSLDVTTESREWWW